jgi:beta-glucosidase
MYIEDEPQFHFGEGLSYTQFEYTKLTTGVETLFAGAPINVGLTVKNVGIRAGDDVVQLYVSFPESKVSRPRKALRGFRRVHLEPGEATPVRFVLDAKDLAYWNTAVHAWVIESGPVDILVGRSSAAADLTLHARVEAGDRPAD